MIKYKFIILFLLFCGCNQVGNNELQSESIQPVLVQDSAVKYISANTSSTLFFIHDSLGEFWTCNSIDTYKELNFEYVDYHVETGEPIQGLEYSEGFLKKFNLRTFNESNKKIVRITSSIPEFYLSNGVKIGIAVKDLLKIDSTLVFHHSGGDLAAHLLGEKYMAVVGYRMLGNIDKTKAYGKELNSQVNPEAEITHLEIWDICKE